jgi:hypothetical protein
MEGLLEDFTAGDCSTPTLPRSESYYEHVHATALSLRCNIISWSKEFMGDVRFWQFAKCMIQGGF